MGMLDEYQGQIKAIFSDWIKINDKNSGCGYIIEDFPFKPVKNQELTDEEKQQKLGIPKDGVDSHCWKCISINQCIFKNEENKKPEEFNYSQYSYAEIPKSVRGLYHPNCHCKKKGTNVPRLNEISIIEYNNKVKDFFNRKSDWFHKWGFTDKDKETFSKTLFNILIENYRQGNYIKVKHTRFGFQINILITTQYKDKINKVTNLKSSYMVYPNSQLRCVTLVGGEE